MLPGFFVFKGRPFLAQTDQSLKRKYMDALTVMKGDKKIDIFVSKRYSNMEIEWSD